MWSMWSSSNSSRSNAVSQVKLITSIEVLHVLKFNWTTSILFISNKLHKSLKLPKVLELLTCSDWLNLLCHFGFENYCSEWVGIRWRMVPHSCEVILLSQWLMLSQCPRVLIRYVFTEKDLAAMGINNQTETIKTIMVGWMQQQQQ